MWAGWKVIRERSANKETVLAHDSHVSNFGAVVKGGAVCRYVGGKLWVKRSAGAGAQEQELHNGSPEHSKLGAGGATGLPALLS